MQLAMVLEIVDSSQKVSFYAEESGEPAKVQLFKEIQMCVYEILSSVIFIFKVIPEKNN